MSVQGYTLFETALGVCALVWGQGGVLAVQWPADSAAAARAALGRRRPDVGETAPPSAVARAAEAVTGLIAGQPIDLRWIRLDTSGLADFDFAVYAAARGVGPGETTTYGQLARRIGEPDAARAVGRSLGANPYPIIVPCHRVLAAGGGAGGFSAPGGLASKARLLSIERARTRAEPLLFDDLPISVKIGRPEARTTDSPLRLVDDRPRSRTPVPRAM